MFLLILGLVIFLGAHLIPTRPALRAQMATTMSDVGYKGFFTAVSILGLLLIVWGYGAAMDAGPIVLWDPPVWTRHLVATLLIPLFPILLAAYLPGRIKSTLKHPMLTAVKLWAFAHLLANGTLPDLLLFGGFLAYGVFDRISVKRRGVALPAPVTGWTRNDSLAVGLGLALYLAFIWRLHLLLFGVSPF